MGIPLLGVGIIVASNALLDESSEREDELRIIDVEYDSEDGDSDVTAVGNRDLGEVELSFDDDDAILRVDHRVKIWTKAGRLGARWHTKSAQAHAGNRVLR